MRRWPEELITILRKKSYSCVGIEIKKVKLDHEECKIIFNAKMDRVFFLIFPGKKRQKSVGVEFISHKDACMHQIREIQSIFLVPVRPSAARGIGRRGDTAVSFLSLSSLFFALLCPENLRAAHFPGKKRKKEEKVRIRSKAFSSSSQ